MIPNLGVWIPPNSEYGGGGEGQERSNDQQQRRNLDGAGAEGLALCVSVSSEPAMIF